jgi:hypothetical protein
MFVYYGKDIRHRLTLRGRCFFLATLVSSAEFDRLLLRDDKLGTTINKIIETRSELFKLIFTLQMSTNFHSVSRIIDHS